LVHSEALVNLPEASEASEIPSASVLGVLPERLKVMETAARDLSLELPQTQQNREMAKVMRQLLNLMVTVVTTL
jgi:hypothetical protein